MDLSAIKKRLSKATQGTWMLRETENGAQLCTYTYVIANLSKAPSLEDTQLIVCAPQDIKDLIEEVERLTHLRELDQRELDEQCRLLGAGGERELRLMAQVEETKRDRAALLAWLVKQGSRGAGTLIPAIENGEYRWGTNNDS